MNGTPLTLGLVGALAAAGALGPRGSASESPEGADERAEALRRQISKLKALHESTGDDDLLDLLALKERKLAALLPFTAEGRQISKQSSAERWSRSLRSAETLAELIRAEKGAPGNLRVWSKEGVGVHLYFPGDQFLTFNGADFSTFHRGKLSFDLGAFYPAQKRGIYAAMNKYRARTETP